LPEVQERNKMRYVWLAIKLLCFPFVVLDKTMDEMLYFEKFSDVVNGIDKYYDDRLAQRKEK
jgi:hypothetical protein